MAGNVGLAQFAIMALSALLLSSVSAFGGRTQLYMSVNTPGGTKCTGSASMSSRRNFFVRSVALPAAATVGAIALPSASNAAGKTEIFSTDKGVKYAILKPASGKAVTPQQGDIVAVEYTGYLSSGQIFDSTHSEGKKNALLFKLGDDVVIAGLNDMISNMSVGMKVQAIIPPGLAFGEKGVCLEEKPEECLIKPGSTLVYDVFLKKSSIPPP